MIVLRAATYAQGAFALPHPGAPFADKKSLPLYYDFEKAV